MNKKKSIIILIGVASLLFLVSIVILLNTNHFKLNNETPNNKNQSNEIIHNKIENDNSSETEIKENIESNKKEEVVNREPVTEKEERLSSHINILRI